MKKRVHDVWKEDGNISNISFDVRYNSSYRANRRKFEQAASQA